MLSIEIHVFDSKVSATEGANTIKSLPQYNGWDISEPLKCQKAGWKAGYIGGSELNYDVDSTDTGELWIIKASKQ